MAAIEVAQARGLTAADLAAARLSRAGGALVVRLADGRVIVVPGFFPHEQPPLPPDAAPAGAIVLPVDHYYALVAGAEGGGGTALEPSTDPQADQLAGIAPAAGPESADAAPPAGALAAGSSDSGQIGGLRGADPGAGAAPMLLAIASPAPPPGDPVVARDAGASPPPEPAADPGPQPPLALLAGLPLALGAGVIGASGSVAAGGAATPSAGATAGNTGGQGQSVLQLVPSGNYVVTALFNGYRVTDSGTGQSSDTIPQFGLVLRVDDLSDGIRGNSSVSIGDPQNWLFKRLARFDATPGGLGIATGTYNKVLNLGFVVEVMRPGIGPVGTTPPPFPFDITNTLGGAVTQYLVTGPGTLVIADPDDPDFFAANGSGIPGVSAITTNNNQFDFSRVDGSKLHNVFVIDAANSQPSTVTVDADLFDAAILQRIAVDSGRFTGFLAKFFEIRADAVDQVTFADPQNWEVDGLLANGQLQYHALNTVNLVFLEMPATLAAKPAYRFAGTAADDTIRIPDLDIGLIDGGGGVNTLQIVGASADLAALGPGRIANFGFLDFSAGGTADTITVDHAFVAASAPGGHLTLLGDAADRAVVADLATAWTYNGHFTASPDGTPHLFLQFRAPADGALLDVQSELATLFPPIDRVGTAGDDVLPIDATPLAQRIDGGAGFDRLQPMGAGALDLTALALGSSVRNVEALDLRGQGANALTLDDVFVADSTVDGVLSVLGEAGDSLTLTGGWTKTGSFPVGAQVFDRWQATTPLGEAVVAFVDQQLQTQAA